jgi:hypothetical protein
MNLLLVFFMGEAKKLLFFLAKTVEKLENNNVDPFFWAISFSGIVALRVSIEKIAQKIPSESGSYLLVFYFQNLFFFILTIILLWIWLSFLLKVNPKKLANLMLWGAWLIIFPPLIDMLWTGGSIFWSFYLLNDLKGLWSQFYTIFGNLPPAIVYFGTKITFLTAIFLLSFFVYLKSKSVVKALLNIIVTYTIFFFMASFPSWFSFGYYSLAEKISIFNINEFKVLGLLATPSNIFSIKYGVLMNILSYKLNIIFFLLLLFLLVILFSLIDRKRLLLFFKNYLLPAYFFFTLFLLFAGMGLGYRAYPKNFDINLFSILGTICLIACITLSSMATKFAYNYYVKKRISVSDYRGDKQIIGIVFILSLIGSIIISVKFFLLLLIYFILIFLYSSRPFKLNNFPGAAELVVLCTTLIVLFTGYGLISNNQTIDHFPWRIGILLLFSAILFLHIRKIKVPAFSNGEKAALSAAFWGKNGKRMAVSAELFVFFVASVVILNEFRLFWWALVAGGVSFWLILSENENIKKRISWFILLIIASYAIVAARITFGF